MTTGITARVRFERALRHAGMERGSGDHRWQCPSCRTYRALKVSVGDVHPLVVFCHSDAECEFDEILDHLNAILDHLGLDLWDREAFFRG
jgi:hypothetical protein